MKCQFCDNRSGLNVVEIEEGHIARYVCGECLGVISEVAKLATENRFIVIEEKIDNLEYKIMNLRESLRSW